MVWGCRVQRYGLFFIYYCITSKIYMTMKKLFFLLLTVCLSGCTKEDANDQIPVIPVHLDGIEAVNVDNSGEFPFVALESVPKEAYMIGVRWETDDSEPAGDQTITPPITTWDPTGRSEGLSDYFEKRIYCVTAFNQRNPAGSNVSQYFKQVAYLPAGIDEGFVLLVAPDPGEHSFRVVYKGSGNTFEYTTQPIRFY